jgi:ribosome-binding protein aMBF1 (putative translation factor)
MKCETCGSDLVEVTVTGVGESESIIVCPQCNPDLMQTELADLLKDTQLILQKRQSPATSGGPSDA